MSNEEFIQRHNAAMVLNYGKLPAVMTHGEGSRLWDADGKEYLDMFAGFGGTILGHAHPALVHAIIHQARAVWTVGNQFYTEPQIILAERLRKAAFDGRAFFCHSGAESNEAAIKLARISAGATGGKEGRHKVISMQKGFHGRTMGALSATPTHDYQKGFFPLVPGFDSVPYNDLAALEQAIDAETCAVIVEPMQGEGGLNIPAADYLSGVRALCDKHKLAMICDEVWTGCARTGKNFCYQYAGVTPDILTLGKALGGGLPVGCMFTIPERAAFLKPGTHGCTLGGNPICAGAAATVLEVIEKENLAERANQLGDVVRKRVAGFSADARGKIKDVRGRGLMLGLELNAADGAPLLKESLARGLIINVTQKNVVRLAPALTIPEKQLHAALDVFEQALLAS